LPVRMVSLLVVSVFASLFAGCVAVNQRASSDEDIAKANVDLASEYFRKGQLNHALDISKKALRYHPNSVQGNILIALVYERLEKFDKADGFLETAVDLVKKETVTYSYIHNVYGAFLCKRGRAEEAQAHFEIAINNKLNQNLVATLENAGFCAYEQQNYDIAERYFRQALKLNPAIAGVLFKMAKLKFETKANLLARAYIQRYHSLTRGPESLALAIKIERGLNAESEAVKLIRELKKLFPGSKQAQAY